MLRFISVNSNLNFTQAAPCKLIVKCVNISICKAMLPFAIHTPSERP